MIELHGQVTTQRLHGQLNVVPNEGSKGGPLQGKTAYPSHSQQVIVPDEDYYGLVSVTIEPVPKLPICEAHMAGGVDTRIYSGLVIAPETAIVFPSGVKYYYNHEQLPEIPAEVIENYPYILIMRYLSGTIRIYASTVKAYFWTTDEGANRITFPTGNYVRYTFNSGANAWILDSSGTGTYFAVHGDGSWAVWWSNYDVPNGSADAEEIYWHASEPTAEQPAYATHFYYNGILLPKIPEGITSEYPYIFTALVSSGEQRLYAFSTVPYWYPTETYPTCMKAAGAGVQYGLAENGEAWEFAKDHSSMYGTFSNGIAWANYDIPNGSETSTTIYHYGTPAVPDPTE